MSVESANMPNSVGNNQDIYSWQNYTANHSEAPKKSSKKKILVALIVVVAIALGVGGYFGIKGIDNAMKEKHRVETTADNKLYKTDMGNTVVRIKSTVIDLEHEGKSVDEILAYLDQEITNAQDEGFKIYLKAYRADYIGGYVDSEQGIKELKELENQSDESYVREQIYNMLMYAYRRKGDDSMSDYYRNEAAKYR